MSNLKMSNLKIAKISDGVFIKITEDNSELFFDKKNNVRIQLIKKEKNIDNKNEKQEILFKVKVPKNIDEESKNLYV